MVLVRSYGSGCGGPDGSFVVLPVVLVVGGAGDCFDLHLVVVHEVKKLLRQETAVDDLFCVWLLVFFVMMSMVYKF